MLQQAAVEVGAEILMALPQADVSMRGTIVRVEREDLPPECRWFTVWTDAFGGFAVVIYERTTYYRVVNRPRTAREAVRRVLRCRAKADALARRDDEGTSS